MYKLIDGLLYKSERCVMIPLSASTEDQCAICMRMYHSQPFQWRQKAYVKKLNCSHVFHAECINRWLQKGTTCPLCRTSLFRHVSHSEILFGDTKYTLVPVTAHHWNIITYE